MKRPLDTTDDLLEEATSPKRRRTGASDAGGDVADTGASSSGASDFEDVTPEEERKKSQEEQKNRKVHTPGDSSLRHIHGNEGVAAEIGCLWKHGNSRPGGPQAAYNHCVQCQERQKKGAPGLPRPLPPDAGDRHLYDYPAYARAVGTPAELRWFQNNKQESTQGPAAGEWDVPGGVNPATPKGNFKSVNRPYYHNAHHMMPYSVLHRTIQDTVPSAMSVVMNGLLDEKYNLNHWKNMIDLPMDPWVAEVLLLPRHLVDPASQDHAVYSLKVESSVKKIFAPLAKSLCKPIDYAKVRKALEQVEDELHTMIIAAGTASAGKQVALSMIKESKFPDLDFPDDHFAAAG